MKIEKIKKIIPKIKKTIPKLKTTIVRCRKLNLDDRYFLVCSDGQTATLWLAAALNIHPDIFCSHGYSYPPIGAEMRNFTKDERLHRRASVNRFWTLSLQRYFDELKEATTKKNIGNVHAFTYSRIKKALPFRPTPDNLLIMNMVRHPISRLCSVAATWGHAPHHTKLNPYIHDDFNTHCGHILDFLKKYNLDYDCVQTKVFVVALFQQEMIAKDVIKTKKDNIFNVVFEEITQNKIYFKHLLEKILNTTDLPDDYLESVFSMSKPINRHNLEEDKSPKNQYTKWQDWQRDVFNFIFTRNKLSEVYEGFSYDFSFLAEQN